MTYFGQCSEWSHEGKKILFLEKTFGQAFTVGIGTKIIRPVTLNYFNAGYTRVPYLSNGDILLSGAHRLDTQNPWPSRRKSAVPNRRIVRSLKEFFTTGNRPAWNQTATSARAVRRISTSTSCASAAPPILSA